MRDRIVIDPLTETGRRAAESVLALVDAAFGVRGLPAGPDAVSWSATFAAGEYTAGDTPTLVRGPIWTAIHLEPPSGWRESAELDLGTATVRHVLQHDAHDAPVEIARLLSAADHGVGLQTVVGPASAVAMTDPLVAASGAEAADVTFVNGVEVIEARDDESGGGIVVAAHDDVRDDRAMRSLVRYVGMAANDEDDPLQRAADRLARARRLGASAIEGRHVLGWAERWATCGTWLTRRPDLERGTMFATFHLLCCGSGSPRRRAEEAQRTGRETAIGARGLTGTSYRGHVFWDTDVFVIPALSAIAPTGARRALNYRWERLEPARERAASGGWSGARFPWESARDGREVTPRTGRDLAGREIEIRTGELEEHITADVAWAVGNHLDWTGDESFARGRGLEILVATARYWASRIEVDHDGSGHIRNVIGPDEYHEAVDDNVFTNVMARHNLLLSADAAERIAACDLAETSRWRNIAECLVDGCDPITGLYEQFSGYHDLVDTAVASIAEPPFSADVLLGREATSNSRIIKQPDVLMAYHLVPDLMRADAFAANLEHYDRYTAHGSSLSPAIMASLFFRARRWEDAMRWFRLAANLDLDDVTGTTAGGLHTATQGGVWQAVTTGMLGVRADRAALTLDPHVPPDLGPVRHRLRFRDRVVTIDVDGEEATVESTQPLDLRVGAETRSGSTHRIDMTTTGWEHR